MIGKACGECQGDLDSAGRSAARGRFPDQAKNFPDTTIYVPVKLN
jgi:hypothetical protein